MTDEEIKSLYDAIVTGTMNMSREPQAVPKFHNEKLNEFMKNVFCPNLERRRQRIIDLWEDFLMEKNVQKKGIS